MTLRNEDAFTGWHAHIYYSDAEERAHAAVLREAIEARFEMRMGRWRDEPGGAIPGRCSRSPSPPMSSPPSCPSWHSTAAPSRS
jgi:hypothetical protein